MDQEIERSCIGQAWPACSGPTPETIRKPDLYRMECCEPG